MAFEITAEQLDALESDYMTRDTIQLIIDSVKLTASSPKNLKDLKELKLSKHLKDAYTCMYTICIKNGDCTLFKLADEDDYCSTKCPFGTDGGCELRRVTSTIMKVLEQ